MPGGVLDMRDLGNGHPMVLAASRREPSSMTFGTGTVGWDCLLAYGAAMERAWITLMADGEFFYERRPAR